MADDISHFETVHGDTTRFDTMIRFVVHPNQTVSTIPQIRLIGAGLMHNTENYNGRENIFCTDT